MFIAFQLLFYDDSSIYVSLSVHELTVDADFKDGVFA